MSSIRLFTSSDEHISDQNPALRVDEYINTVLNKINWQHEFAKNAGCEAIIRGGDLFHHKNPSKTSHMTMLKLMEILKKHDLNNFVLIGNHDVVNSNLDNLSRAPLGVMYQMPRFNRLHQQVFQRGSLSVEVVSIDYSPLETLDSLKGKILKNHKYNYTIAVVHALAEDKPKESLSKFFGDAVFAYEDLDFPGVADVLVFGHYHKDQGIRKLGNTQIVNLGSLTRGSLTFENMNRKPKNAMITLSGSGVSIEEIVVPHADASKVFDIRKKESIEKEIRDITEFVDKLRRGSNTSFNGIEDFKLQLEKEYPEKIAQMALRFLEAAESGDVVDT